MSTNVIVTSTEAEAFIIRAIERTVGGPGPSASIPATDLVRGAGTVTIELTYSTWAPKGEHGFKNQRMQISLHHDHVNGSARVADAVTELDFVQHTLSAAAEAFGLPQEWPFLFVLDLTRGFSIKVMPLAGGN